MLTPSEKFVDAAARRCYAEGSGDLYQAVVVGVTVVRV